MSYGKALVQLTWSKEETDSIASRDCLTKIYDTVALNVIQKTAQISKKNSFYD